MSDRVQQPDELWMRFWVHPFCGCAEPSISVSGGANFHSIPYLDLTCTNCKKDKRFEMGKWIVRNTIPEPITPKAGRRRGARCDERKDVIPPQPFEREFTPFDDPYLKAYGIKRE